MEDFGGLTQTTAAIKVVTYLNDPHDATLYDIFELIESAKQPGHQIAIVRSDKGAHGVAIVVYELLTGSAMPERLTTALEAELAK